MASKQILTGDAAAKKLWASSAGQEWTWGRLFSQKSWGFMSKGNQTMFKENRQFKEYGDEVTETFIRAMTGDGTVGGASIEGTEDAPPHFNFKYAIEELTSVPFGARSKMDDQRVPWDVVKNGKDSIRKWWGPILDAGPMLHLTGYTPEVAADHYRPSTRPIRAGAAGGLGHQWTCLNPVFAPNEEPENPRILRAAAVAGDELLTTESTHKMTSLLLDELIATAPQTIPPVEPCKWAGGEHYFVFMHTDQHADLRRDAQFDAIENATLQGGEAFEGHPLATGNVRPYRGCIIVVSNWNPPGVDLATNTPVVNTRRAVLVGAQAMGMGWGSGEGENRFRFFAEPTNIGGGVRCVSRAIWGGAKVRYDRGDGIDVDFGTFVLSTFAKNRGDTGQRFTA